MKNMNWKAIIEYLKIFATLIILTGFVVGINYLTYEAVYQKGHLKEFK